MKKLAAILLASVLLWPSGTIAEGTINWNDRCIANAIHYESRGEPLAGQRAVYDVIRHRAEALGVSVCHVVMARKQFSWFGKVPFLPLTDDMRELVERVRSHPRILTNEKFRWFFGKHIRPIWSRQMVCYTIGGHRFCREKE